ncbi:MAG TPA: hypothetical protein VIJ20_12075 [Solirubrobacteraceae bacterium]
MNVIQNLITDLREKRLWPVAVALILALIVVPVLLSGGGNKSVPVAQVPPTGSSSAPVPALPAVSVTTTPSNARLTGRERNPFAQQAKQKSGSGGSKSSKAKGSSGSGTGSTTSGAVSGTSTTVASTPATSTPVTSTTPTPPEPTGLTATQAYHVAMSMSNSAGGLYTIDPVERLSVLPNAQLPLLIELGVLNGGRRVLYLVQPGTVVRGPGKCTPGPIDCEIVSLAPNEIEWLGTSGPSGATGVALMAVTAITATNFPSAAAAHTARKDESAAGRRLLSQSNLSALSLFDYKPSLGAVIDLSNVTVGGS